MGQVSCATDVGYDATDDLLIGRAIQRADEDRKQLERGRGRVRDILDKDMREAVRAVPTAPPAAAHVHC